MNLIDISNLDPIRFLQLIYTLTPSLTALRKPSTASERDSLTFEEASTLFDKAKVKDDNLYYLPYCDTYQFSFVRKKLLTLTITQRASKLTLNADAYILKYGQIGFLALQLSFKLSLKPASTYFNVSLLTLQSLFSSLGAAGFYNQKFTNDVQFSSPSIKTETDEFDLSPVVLGEGAFGRVNIGHDKKGQVVAVKEVAKLAKPSVKIAPFEVAKKEMDTLKRLGLFQASLETKEKVYIIKNFISGGELPKTTTYAEKIRIILSLACELNQHHVIQGPHADLKLDNILFDSLTGCCTLIDGGCAMNPKPPFAAPEVRLITTATMDEYAADMFSFGVFIGTCFGFIDNERKTTDSVTEDIYSLYKKLTDFNPTKRPNSFDVVEFFLKKYRALTFKLSVSVTAYSKPTYLVLKETLDYLCERSITTQEETKPQTLLSVRPVIPEESTQTLEEKRSDYYELVRQCYGRPLTEDDCADSFAPKGYFRMYMILKLDHNGIIHFYEKSSRSLLANSFVFELDPDGTLYLKRSLPIEKGKKHWLTEKSLGQLAFELYELEKRSEKTTKCSIHSTR